MMYDSVVILIKENTDKRYTVIGLKKKSRLWVIQSIYQNDYKIATLNRDIENTIKRLQISIDKILFTSPNLITDKFEGFEFKDFYSLRKVQPKSSSYKTTLSSERALDIISNFCQAFTGSSISI